MKKHSKYKVYLNFKLFKLKISSFLNRFIFYIFTVKKKSAPIKNLFLIKFL
ncbi:RepA protein [Campylobacter jejuni]|nr:RepA protein [Campylobacter jejuni]